MRRVSKLLLVMVLVGAVNAPVLYAATPVSIGFGYLNTNSDNYESGFVWGATIRGDQRLTFGVGVRFYENTVQIESEVNPGTTFAEEKYRIFSVSPYAYYDLFKGKPDNQILLGAGLQVHFVNSSRSIFIAGTSIGARETRLGFGGLVRYERRIRMFQEMFFAAEVYYSYMEGTFEKVDNYQPPLEAINMVGILIGLGYPL